MTTITTRKEQSATASAARKVGGYSELVRLAAEHKEKGAGSTVKRNASTGKWVVSSSSR